MLGEFPVLAMIPIRDVERSKKFYGEILGLKLVDENPMVLRYESGGTTLVVYKTMVGITAEHTLATWRVKDVESTVNQLKEKGVKFEEYDMPGLKTENSIATDPDEGKGAWFKDPDGNILSVLEGQ